MGEKMSHEMSDIQHLLNVVNRITAPWRHKENKLAKNGSVPAKHLDELCSAQLLVEASLAEPVTPRAKLIRDAKALIRALKLPVGGGVAFWNCDWWVCNEQPKASLYSWSFGDNASAWTLPRNLFQEYPGDWKDSFITIDTPEQGGE